MPFTKAFTVSKTECDSFSELFENFLDGDDVLSRDVFNAHMELCSDCRDNVYWILEVQGRLRSMRATGKVLSSTSDVARVVRTEQRLPFRIGAFVAAASSTAAFVVFALTVGGGLFSQMDIVALFYLGLLVPAIALPWASVFAARHAAFGRKLVLWEALVYGGLLIVGSQVTISFVSNDYVLAELGFLLSYAACDLALRSVNLPRRLSGRATSIQRLLVESKSTKWRYRLAMALVVSAPILISSSFARGSTAPSQVSYYSVTKATSNLVTTLPCNPVERKQLIDSKTYI